MTTTCDHTEHQARVDAAGLVCPFTRSRTDGNCLGPKCAAWGWLEEGAEGHLTEVGGRPPGEGWGDPKPYTSETGWSGLIWHRPLRPGQSRAGVCAMIPSPIAADASFHVLTWCRPAS